MKLKVQHRRFAIGAAVSLAVHALVAAWLLWARSRPAPLPPPPPRAPAIEVVLRERPAPAPPAAAIAAPQEGARPAHPKAPARPPPPQVAKKAAQKPAAPRAVAQAPAPAGGAAQAPSAAQGGSGSAAGAGAGADQPGHAAWSDRWLEQEGLARGGGAPGQAGGGAGGGFSTALSDPGGALGIGPAAPAELPRAEPIVPESAQAARQRVKGRVQAFVESFKAHERTQIPDVYWRNMRQELERSFEVPYEVYLNGPTGGRGAITELARQYQRDASEFGRTGNPFVGDPRAPGAPRTLQDDTMVRGLQERGVSEAALGQVEMMARQVDAATSQRLVARILVSQREDGTLADVALIGPSGNIAYDRIALAKARTLLGKELEKLGPLPREGRKSLWAFETDFRIIPPMPIAGCQLDAFFIPRDCYYPLQKKTRSHVRLEALY